MKDVWFTRDQLVLDRIVTSFDVRDEVVVVAEYATALGLTDAQVEASMRALGQGGLIKCTQWGIVNWTPSSGRYQVLKVTQEARRLVGGWPSDAAQALLVQLDVCIDQAADTAEKSRLLKLRDAVEDLGVKLVSELIVKAATAAAG